MFRKPISLAIASTFLAGAAHGATVYSDRASFNAAGAGPGVYTDLNYGGIDAPAPFTRGPLTVDGSATYWTYGTAGLYGAVNGTAWVQARLDTWGSEMTVSSTGGFRAIGFDLRSYFDGFGGDLGETVSFVANTGESGVFVTPPTADIGFVGLLFSSAVTSVVFAATDGGGNDFTWFGIDDVQFWQNAAPPGVPEPASWAMLIAGFGLVGAAIRSRRSATAVA